MKEGRSRKGENITEGRSIQYERREYNRGSQYRNGEYLAAEGSCMLESIVFAGDYLRSIWRRVVVLVGKESIWWMKL